MTETFFQTELITDGELIYTCKIGFLAGLNLQVRIKPAFFSRFSQPENFYRFKPDHLLLNRARFSGDNLCYNMPGFDRFEFTGSNLDKYAGFT